MVIFIITNVNAGKHKQTRFSKALLLGLAIACNFGGMMTPISSVQNVLAVSALEQV